MFARLCTAIADQRRVSEFLLEYAFHRNQKLEQYTPVELNFVYGCTYSKVEIKITQVLHVQQKKSLLRAATYLAYV